MAALAPTAAAQEPDADFSVSPVSPVAGENARYEAELRGGLGSGSPAVRWDFNRDGRVDRRGRRVTWRYATPGVKEVTMRVIGDDDDDEVRATVTKAVVVVAPAPAPPPPDPEPQPEPNPAPSLPAPPALPPEQEVGDLPVELISPFPVVRIAGVLMPWGARVRLLTVRTPRGSTVTVRCKGKGCPLRPLRRRARTGLVRIRSFERRLRAGIRLEFFVRQGDLIGKYTRLRIRGGAPPLRVDRCLEPGARQPVRCPAA